MNKKKHVYFIRHGNTEWNALQRFQGKTDTALSELGNNQALLLARRMKRYNLDIIYSSSLKRAVETAKAVADTSGAPIVTLDILKEVDFGRWEGLTLLEIKKRYGEEYEKCRKDPVKYGFRYGLAYDDVKKNALSFIEECILGTSYETIAVVSHSVIIKMMLISLLELPAKCFHSLYLSNCSISLVDVGLEKNVLLRLNDNAHIEMAEAGGVK